MLEKEVKYTLTKSQYENIKEKLFALGDIKSKLQINYYYDTEKKHLHKNDITLRIRQVDSNLNLEVKYPVEKHIKKEKHLNLASLKKTIDLNNDFYKKTFSEISNYGLVLMLGNLSTYRISYEYTKGIRFELDKSYYLGVVDYELEVEFEENCENNIKKLVENIFGNNLGLSIHGKRDRFFILKDQIDHL